MRVSIITVCKNAESLIEESIRSVCTQSYKDIEYIIIDGNSSDKTKEIIDKYREKISHYISEEDNGIYDAMNKGISIATGDIVFFLNAGDTLYDQNVVKIVVDEFSKSNFDIVFGDVLIVVDSNSKQLKSHSNINKAFFLYNTICHQAIFFRRNVFNICGFYNTNFKICSDYEWLLKAFCNYKFKFKHIDLIIANYLRGGISSVKEYEEVRLFEHNLITNNYFNFFEKKLYSKGMFIRLVNRPLFNRIFRKTTGWKIS